MRVPIAAGGRHEPGARFDQAPGSVGLRGQGRAAVRCPLRFRLLVDAQCNVDLVRSQNRGGIRLKTIELGKCFWSRTIKSMVNSFENSQAPREILRRESIGKPDLLAV